MNIIQLLNNVDFCIKEPRDFQISSTEKIPYYCCKRSIITSCSKNCINCGEIYARYLIVNLYDDDTRKLCEEYIFSTAKVFDEFQKNYIAKMFFYENDIVRYNIYLVFIWDKRFTITNMEYIAKDINYARKLFLNEKEFLEYFSFFKSIEKTEDVKNGINDKYTEIMRSLVGKLDREHMKGILLQLDDRSSYLGKLLNYLMSDDVQFDRYLGIKASTADFVQKNIYRTPKGRRSIGSKKRIEQINRVVIHSFRETCFTENTAINCARVNLLSGPNAAGKSSVLDAIEFGLTGKTHKNINDDTLSDSYVEIETGSNVYTNPDKRQMDRLKQQWYPYYMGTLNDLFCRINYFDTDATYRFALEQGEGKEAFAHIERLLCNSKLLEMEETVLEYLSCAKTMKEVFNKRDKVSSNGLKHRIQEIFKKMLGFIVEDAMVTIDFNAKLNKFMENSVECLYSIHDLIYEQISSNITIIDTIFRRIFSYQYEVIWKDDKIQIMSVDNYKTIPIDAMSTAQKVCFALSVIFTQFLLSEHSPNFILLDESVANFDSLHLLNLLDFLRELANNGVQVFLTTANDDVTRIAKAKFGFLEKDFIHYSILKSDNGLSVIQKVE